MTIPTIPPTNGNGKATLVSLLGLVAIAAIALGGVLFVAPGDESTQRLGLLFGLLGTVATTLVAVVKAGQAAHSADVASERLAGDLDLRIESAITRAMAARRSDDPTPADSIAPPSYDDETPAR